MSHVAAEGSKAEPNLTPLLDVVLQLLMFFMMCVNFVTEQVNERIQLPVAQSARPMDKTESDVLFLNLNRAGNLEVLGRDQPLTSQAQWRDFLKTQFTNEERADRLKGGKGQVKTSIIIRADRSVEYKQVYELLQLCKTVGYRKLRVRAITKAGG